MSERIDLTEAPLPRARRPAPSGGNGRGSGWLKLDEFAGRVLPLAAIVSALLLLYLLWGLWGGAWSHQTMGLLPAARRQQQLDNIALVFRLMQCSSLVTVAALLVCSARAEGVGYWLLGMAAVFYGGLPYLTPQIYALRHQTASQAGGMVMADFQLLAWLFAVPGCVWTLLDLGRRFVEASQKAAAERATAKYGVGVQKQTPVQGKHRQVFLGRCWEGPFCRDNIRVKCPIYLRKRGPCWRYKEGCMCEERIVLQALISKDWKQQSAQATQALETGGPRKYLTPAALRERCRNCIIYNEHQRQKHKALTTVVLIAGPALLIWNLAWLQSVVNRLLFGLDAATKRFSFNADPAGITALHNGAYSLIAWVCILSLSVILLSQVMKFIEYCCFKLKI